MLCEILSKVFKAKKLYKTSGINSGEIDILTIGINSGIFKIFLPKLNCIQLNNNTIYKIKLIFKPAEILTQFRFGFAIRITMHLLILQTIIKTINCDLKAKWIFS